MFFKKSACLFFTIISIFLTYVFFGEIILTIIGTIIGFIVLSIVIGYFVFVYFLEKSLEEEEESHG